MKPCVIKSKRKGKSKNWNTMNTGEIITTEINTEIKVEVQLETASIVKVETTKGKCNKPITDIGKSEFNAAIDMSSKEAPSEDKSRDEVKAAREAKKLAKQAKKLKANGLVENDAIANIKDAMSPTNKFVNQNNIERSSSNQEFNEKNREQIKAEREAKKQAKQAAKAAKVVSAAAVTPVTIITEKLNQVNVSETSDVPNDDASIEYKSPFRNKHIETYSFRGKPKSNVVGN